MTLPDKLFHQDPGPLLREGTDQLVRCLREGDLDGAHVWLTRYAVVAAALIDRRERVREGRLGRQRRDPSRLP